MGSLLERVATSRERAGGPYLIGAEPLGTGVADRDLRTRRVSEMGCKHQLAWEPKEP